MNEKDKIKLQQWVKHHEQSYAQAFYSMQRFDLMIISISGVGIYVILEIMRFLHNEPHDFLMLKIGGVVFTLAIILNFISQLTSYRMNINEVEWTNIKIESFTNPDPDEGVKKELETLDVKITKFSRVTQWLNIASTILMTSGIVILLWFNIVTFK